MLEKSQGFCTCPTVLLPRILPPSLPPSGCCWLLLTHGLTARPPPCPCPMLTGEGQLEAGGGSGWGAASGEAAQQKQEQEQRAAHGRGLAGGAAAGTEKQDLSSGYSPLPTAPRPRSLPDAADVSGEP